MTHIKCLLEVHAGIPRSEQLDEPSPTSETIEKAAQVAGIISIVYMHISCHSHTHVYQALIDLAHNYNYGVAWTDIYQYSYTCTCTYSIKL